MGSFSSVPRSPSGTVVWRYLLEHEDAGTRVSESYDVTKPAPALATWFPGVLLGVVDRDADLVAGMRATLDRLKQAAEGAPGSG